MRLLEAGSCDLARLRGQSEGERAGLLRGAEDGAGTDEVGDGGELVITHHKGGSGAGSAKNREVKQIRSTKLSNPI